MSHPPVPKTPMRLVVLAALAIVAIQPAVAAEEHEMPVYLHENPMHALPESINARVGDAIVFRVENPEAEGKGPHNFLVCGDGKKFTEACDEKWGFTGMIQPGERATVTVNITKAGTFEYYCYIPGHKGAGMSGDLIVQGASTEKSAIPFGPLALLALAGLALALRRRSA